MCRIDEDIHNYYIWSRAEIKKNQVKHCKKLRRMERKKLSLQIEKWIEVIREVMTEKSIKEICLFAILYIKKNL